MLNNLPPMLVMLAGALAALVLSGRALRVATLVVPLLALAQCWLVIASGSELHWNIAGLDANPVRTHAATPAFATIFCLAALGGMAFAWGRARRTELVAAFVYAAGALGVVFAGDMLSMLVCWETMLLGSTLIVWVGGQSGSRGAGFRYFALHALGGVIMLGGVALVLQARADAGHADPLEFASLTAMVFDGGHGAWGALMLLGGMLVCAGAPPFSAWAADAYPEGSVTGTIFLSAFTTKTAVFTLIVAFAGLEALVWIGLYMSLYGIVYAVLENDIRRVLAYSIVNQVGFMLVGVGIGTPLALDGATAHAFAHILYKGLLFMCAGGVMVATGKRLMSDLGGLYRVMPLTLGCCIVGALAISAFPLTSGFTTKAMIDDAVALHAGTLAAGGLEASRFAWVWLGLEIASAGVFLHAGIKFPWFVFFNGEREWKVSEPPRPMRMAMLGLAALCLLLGVFPQPLYAMLPYGAAQTEFWPHVYSMANLAGTLALLLFSGAAFFVLLPALKRKRTVTLDFDWFWRAFPRLVWQDLVTPFVQDWGPPLRSARDWVRRNFTPAESGASLYTEMLRNVSGPAFVVIVMLVAYLTVFLLAPAAA